MPTPTKPFSVLKSEGKSHRTKAELKVREQGEKALQTSQKIKPKKEVKKNKIAYKEFKRIVSLLDNIDKSDALYENVINRYAMLYAECYEFEEKRERFYNELNKLDEDYALDPDGMTIKEYYDTVSNIQKNILDLDKQLQNIPKSVEPAENPLLKVLRGE